MRQLNSFEESVLNKAFLKSLKDSSEYIPALQHESKGGFFDLEPMLGCNHPHHEPPQFIQIPQGKGYRHVCPQCGKTTVIIPPQISF